MLMKHLTIVAILAVGATGASAQVTTTSGDPAVIAAIHATMRAADIDTARFRRTEHSMREYSAEDGTLVGFYDGASLRKLSARLNGHSGLLTQHLYYSADRLVFVQSIYDQYETKSRVEHRVYLSADKPIRRIRAQSPARPTAEVAAWDPLPELLGRVKSFVACAASDVATCTAPRAAPAAGAARDTTITLGAVSRDLTADGRPEALTLIAKGRSIDSLNVTLTITSGGSVIYSMDMRPMTRRWYARNWPSSRMTYQAWLKDYAKWFFGAEKFLSPSRFVAHLDSSSKQAVGEIPSTIARDGDFLSDTARGARIWSDIQRAGVVIFEFSPGYDAIVPIGWHQASNRFYRLMECC
jgi:hypothetical protein